jgi:alpha-galactosidase
VSRRAAAPRRAGPKIVVIGAASASFGLGTLRDLMITDALRGSEVALVDLDGEALAPMAALAKRINREWGRGMTIRHTTDRRRALDGADFVVVSIEVDRERRWRMDWEIPLKYGIRQPLGENGGPGGLSHALRVIPPVVAVARDMERICPKAWLLNFTNPMARVCQAVTRYTGVHTVGLCHGLAGLLHWMASAMGVPYEALDAKAAGLNHFTWLLDLRLGGADAYPLLRRRLKHLKPEDHALSRALFDAFGLFPSCGDNHIAEYLPYCHLEQHRNWERYRIALFDWDASMRGRKEARRRIQQLAQGHGSLEELRQPSGERAAAIIAAAVTGANSYEIAVNVVNGGCISNLPDEAVVEIPATVSAFGVRGVSVGPLPEAIATLCRRQVSINQLTAEAAVEGSREAALQALLIDPMINDIATARSLLDDYLRAHADLLPEFASGSARRLRAGG